MRAHLIAPTRRRFLLGGAAAAAALAVPGLPRAQAPLPRRGVNLSHWLNFAGRQPVVAADLLAIRQAGFDHVRLPVDPDRLGWNPRAPTPEGRGPAQVAVLDRAIDMIGRSGLSVVLSFHPTEQRRDEIELQRPAQDAWVEFWEHLARRYAGAAPHALVFQAMNEPQYYVRGAHRWNQLQARAVDAIRAVDRTRLLALSGIGGSSIDYLERTGVIADPAAFYVFHFYEPPLLTHFGATWEPFAKEPAALIARLAYPSTKMRFEAALVRSGPDRREAEKLLQAYIDKPWNAATVEARIALAAAWAQKAGVRLACTEFGVLRTRLDPESRLAWLADVRRALEQHGIGWSVWDYSDLFGIALAEGDVDRHNDGAVAPRDRSNPRRRFDPGALKALGLAA